jgi:hypothetical protein|tara:strand:+ start:11552 stop:12115 length:564 start_codon:yes stop_codon:yes gene_type:complete
VKTELNIEWYSNVGTKIFAILLVMILLFASRITLAQTTLTSAEASFRYISSTLQSFRTTGRLVNNPGVDGSDLEAFISYLETYYEEFSGGFNRNSAMCLFYMDPENARMTIQDKADLSFSYLPDLEARISRYIEVDAEFQDTIEYEFGRILLNNINQQKLSSSSNQRLPTLEFDEAAVISFIDSVCV